MAGVKAITTDNRKAIKTKKASINNIEQVNKDLESKNDENTVIDNGFILQNGAIIRRHEYLLNEIKQMEKKLEFTGRDVGIKIAINAGSVDDQCVVMEADTASYEYFRHNSTALIEDKFGDKYKEDVTKHKIIDVTTSHGNEASIEEKKVFILDEKPITITFYHTNCRIMLQGNSVKK